MKDVMRDSIQHGGIKAPSQTPRPANNPPGQKPAVMPPSQKRVEFPKCPSCLGSGKADIFGDPPGQCEACAGTGKDMRPPHCENEWVPKCPHCGHYETDWGHSGLENDGDEVTFSCASCGKDYIVTMHMNIDFDTRAIEPDAPQR